MDKPPDPSAISSLWSILVSLVLALLAIGGFRAKVATKADLRQVEDSLESDLRKSLYREDGTSVYTPRAECEKNQANCGKRVCDKLDEIQKTNAATLAEMRADTQRRHDEYLTAQREHLRLHEGLPEFVGAVKQFMQQHNNKEG